MVFMHEMGTLPAGGPRARPQLGFRSCLRPTTIVHRGYRRLMETKMEIAIMENQMEKKMENEMETGVRSYFIGVI